VVKTNFCPSPIFPRVFLNLKKAFAVLFPHLSDFYPTPLYSPYNAPDFFLQGLQLQHLPQTAKTTKFSVITPSGSLSPKSMHGTYQCMVLAMADSKDRYCCLDMS